MVEKSDRFHVSTVDNEARGELPTYEVRKNMGGTMCDWYPGEYVALFETEAEAQAFIQGVDYARSA